VLNNIVDFAFLLDIILTFRTSYIDYRGNEIYKPWQIAQSYLSGQFIFDLAATIPIDQIVIFATQNKDPLFRLFGILKLGRVLRLKKLI